MKKNSKPKQASISQMDRVRAAKCMLTSNLTYLEKTQKDAQLEAFMSIFHPEKSNDRAFMNKLKQD